MRIVYIGIQVLLLTAITCIAMGEDNRAEEANRKLQISITGDLVSIQATEATRQEILKEISKITNIQTHGAIHSKKTISISVDHLTMEEVIRRIASNAIIVYQEKSSHSVPKISEIIVLPDGTNIDPLPSKIATNNPAIDSIAESGQQLIDLYGPPPMPPSLPPPPLDTPQ